MLERRDVFDPEVAAARGRGLIGHAVRTGRLRLGWSQRQLAWSSLLAQSTISKLESGKLQGMRYSTLVRVLGVLTLDPGFRLPDGPASPRRRLPGQVEREEREQPVAAASAPRPGGR
ncbi:MAG: helix-turn-helix transcriptional regulator [Chloroflexi bacterium]|nr:helix-turn-helix transcriptional regulator [Chloroflexota bacterium]